jgi:hypothetical protein
MCPPSPAPRQARNLSQLDDASPARWVTAVAGDLGMDDKRAAEIVQAVTTSEARTRLVEVGLRLGWAGGCAGAGAAGPPPHPAAHLPEYCCARMQAVHSLCYL